MTPAHQHGTLPRSVAIDLARTLRRLGWNASAILDRSTWDQTVYGYLVYANRPENRADAHLLATEQQVARFLTTTATHAHTPRTA